MVTKEQIVKGLMERYQKKDIESRLDKEQFQALFQKAVKDYYPKLKEQYADQSIYGISFEIGDVVQKTYEKNFDIYIYFNTEEMYQENIEDCEEDEKDYYRFEAWAEWDVQCAESGLFENVSDYLEQNSLYLCSSISDYEDKLDEAAVIWYQENEFDFEDAFEKECEQIRMWMAEGLGQLRKEGFWEEQGSTGLYVIPFGGECDIETEELIKTYHMMDLGCHGTEYVDYLKSCDAE